MQERHNFSVLLALTHRNTIKVQPPFHDFCELPYFCDTKWYVSNVETSGLSADGAASEGNGGVHGHGLRWRLDGRRDLSRSYRHKSTTSAFTVNTTRHRERILSVPDLADASAQSSKVPANSRMDKMSGHNLESHSKAKKHRILVHWLDT